MNGTDGKKNACAKIAVWFAKRDEELRATTGSSVYDTTHGIWGSTSVDDAFALFERLGVHDGMRFCDLGSGDGRIALIAALFCASIGIEGDSDLDQIAKRVQQELLPTIPQLLRCEFHHADYTTSNLSNVDIIFAFADHAWPEELERALAARERPGTLIAHQDIFRPHHLKKGPTIWIGQTPFVTYPLGKK